MDPTYPLFPILNLIACSLALVPVGGVLGRSLPSTFGAFTFAIWVSLASLILGVNLVVWADTYANVAPIWCDIAVHIQIGVGDGIPASTLVMSRRLCKVVSFRSIHGRAMSKKEVALEIFLAVGLPCIMMGLYYIIQPGRFTIESGVGCIPELDGSWVSMLLYHFLPLVITMISALVYFPWIGLHFYRNPQATREVLNRPRNAKSGPCAQANNLRLLILCLFGIITSLPMGIIKLVHDFAELRGTKVPFWSGWSTIHGSNWGSVSQTPKVNQYTTNVLGVLTLRYSEMMYFVLALALFLLFGVTAEAREGYRRAFWVLASVFGVQHRGIGPTSSLPEMAFEPNADAKSVSSLDTDPDCTPSCALSSVTLSEVFVSAAWSITSGSSASRQSQVSVAHSLEGPDLEKGVVEEDAGSSTSRAEV